MNSSFCNIIANCSSGISESLRPYNWLEKKSQYFNANKILNDAKQWDVHTSFVSLRNVDGNGHKSGGSHFLCVGKFFGDAPIDHPAAELTGKIESFLIADISNIESIGGEEFDTFCSNSYRNFSF